MKKIIFIFTIMFILAGCGNQKLLNKPTKKTEMFFSKYQSLDDDVIEQLKNVTNNELSFFEEDKQEYIEIMKKHYQTLKYEIKDETIDGDMATVTAEIEVTDYSKILNDANDYLEKNREKFNDSNGNYDERLFNKYRIEKLKDAKERVKFTVDINLTRIDDEWTISDIDNITENKIQGVYQY